MLCKEVESGENEVVRIVYTTACSRAGNISLLIVVLSVIDPSYFLKSDFVKSVWQHPLFAFQVNGICAN